MIRFLVLLFLSVQSVAAAAVPQSASSTCAAVGISASKASAVRAAFTSAKVVPDVVPSINPTVDLSVVYGLKAVNLGNTFSATETLAEPKISFTAESNYDPSSTKYVTIILDPDAPSPKLPTFRYFLHLIKYDVQPSCITNQSPKTLAPYQALTPLSVAAHRYTILVYRQPPNYVPQLQISEAPGARNNFNLQSFVAAGNLQLVGGNFFYEGLGSTVCAVTPGCTL